MSHYMNGHQRSRRQNEQLQLFVNNVKREIDTFWSNVLDEFNAFSTEITEKLEAIEQEQHTHVNHLIPDTITPRNANKYDSKQTNHRASRDYSEQNQSQNQSQKHKQNNGKSQINIPNSPAYLITPNNTTNPNETKKYNYKTVHNNTEEQLRDYNEQKQNYKKFAANGNSTSMGHGRTLSTMEIPMSFRLEPIEESILIIKPRAATMHCKDIYTTLLDENFYVTDFEEGTADASYFEHLWAKKYGYLPYFQQLCAEMASDTFLVLKVFRVNAVHELIDLCGSDEPDKAERENANTLRAMFGKSVVQNAVYPSKNINEVEQFNRDFFPNSKRDSLNPHGTAPPQQSLVVIKPNAATQFGDVIRAHLIGQKFEIIQQKVFNLNSFVYSNMAYDAPSEYTQDIVEYMASGAVIALIVQKANVYEALQRVVGDRDPEIAAQNQPESIRANYGENIVKNAIEYAANYEIYKKNIPTFFFDVTIMNTAVDRNAIEQIQNEMHSFQQNQNNSVGSPDDNDILSEEMLQLPEPNKDEGFAIVVIKPHVSSYQIEAIQDVFADNDIQINKQKSINMHIESIREMLAIEYRNNEVIQLMANHLSSDELLVWLCSSKHSDRNIFNVLSSIVPELRDQYGIDEIRDVMHYSTTHHNFKAIAHEFFFQFSGASPPKTPNINLKLKSMDQIHQPIMDESGDIHTPHKRRHTEVKPFISQFTKEQKSIVLIKPHITKNQLFQIRKMLHDVSIEVVKEKQMSLPIDILYSAFEMDGYEDIEYQSMCQYISSDEFIVWMVQRENVYEQLRYVIGPEDPDDARSKYPQSIRAYYGVNTLRNAVYFSPNEHIYNHQIGLFFTDDNDEDGNTEIPLVPDGNTDGSTNLTQFDYINKKLMAHNTNAKLTSHKSSEDTLDFSENIAVGNDEYALVLLSSAVTQNKAILEQIKSRMTQNRFVIVDELTSYLPSMVVNEMFNDGLTTLIADGPPMDKDSFDALVETFSNGEILAIHVCRQNGYLLLDQLKLELEKYKLTTATYITLTEKDYKSKCVHFFDVADSDTAVSKLETPITNTTINPVVNNSYANIAKPVDTHTSHNARQSTDNFNNDSAILLFKPNVTEEQLDDIRRMLREEMLHIFDETQTYIPRKTLRDLLNHEGYDEYYMDQLCEFMAGHALFAWLVKGENVYKELMLIVGPEDSDVARIQAPNSIRAKYGIDKIQNVLYFTKSREIFEKTHRYFFFDEPDNDIIENENEEIRSQSSYSNSQTSQSRRRQNKPLEQQFEEFEKTRSAFSAPKPALMESDEEQRAVIILQHQLSEAEKDSIRVRLGNKGIDIIQQKTSFLPMETYQTIFELAQPNWERRKIAQVCEYYNKGDCTALLVAKPGIYRLLDQIIGNENPLLATQGSIRHMYGIDELKNACFYTKNERCYKSVVDELFFEQQNTTVHTGSLFSHQTTQIKKSVSSTGSSRRIGMEKSILVFKPHMSRADIQQVTHMIRSAGLQIIQKKETYLPKDVWYTCMKEEVVDDAHLTMEAEHLSSGSVTAYLIFGDDAFDKLADLAGPVEPERAKMHMPESIRAMYGLDEVRNCVWWSKNPSTYKRIFYKFFFSEKASQSGTEEEEAPVYNYNNYGAGATESVQSGNTSVNSYRYSASQYRPNNTRSETMSETMTDKTLLIIKPHISKENRQKIKDLLVSHGIRIIQEKDSHLAKESCKYLLAAEGYDEQYITVLTAELNKGELCALLLSKEGIFTELKEIIGPTDPSIARKTNPNSIRALYGKDIVRNVVYYTKSKRHYKKVFSFFFFEDVSERDHEMDEANNGNSALLSANGRGIIGINRQTTPNSIFDDNKSDTETVTSYGYHSHVMYNSCAPCAVLILKPHCMEKQSEIEQLLQSHDIEVLAKRAAAIHGEAIYGFLKSNDTFQSLNPQIMNMIVEDMCNGEVCVYSVGDKTNPSFNRVKESLQRVKEICKIISNKYGLDQIRNAVYCSQTVDEMRKQRKFFFLDSVFFAHESITDAYQYSLMIIKPNAFQYRSKITQLLKSREFHVTVNKVFKNGMDLSTAQQFFHPYFGNDSQFDEFCESMSQGQWCILMVSRVGNCINALRQFTEQIQSMYSSDDTLSIGNKAVYTSECESDFWRDRAFFFFNDDDKVQFMDNGSVYSAQSKPKKKRFGTNSVHSAQSTVMSKAFDLNPIEETVLLIKPHCTQYCDEIEKYLREKGFFIGKSRPMNMPTMVWEDFYRKHENKPWFEQLCSAMAEDQIVSYILYRVNAIKYLRQCIGETDPNTAKIKSPLSLRAMYGTDIIRNGFHASHNEREVIKERSELFFENAFTQSDAQSMSTHRHNRKMDRVLVIIKPKCAAQFGDQIRAHLVGALGFEIVKEKVAHLSAIIYQSLSIDVSQQMFERECEYLASDQIIAMVLEKTSVYSNIGELVNMIGDRDPLIAQRKQPHSIRAIYGKSIVENAVEVSLSREIYTQNFDVFFDSMEDNISETHSYKELKLKNKNKQRQLQRLQKQNKKQKCLLVIKPHISEQNIAQIKQSLLNLEFEIMFEKHVNLPYNAFIDAFQNDYSNNDLDIVCREWSAGEICVFILSKMNAYQTIKTLVGPSDPEIARSEAPNSIRANFGVDRIRNCCWYSPDQKEYHKKLKHFEY